MLNKIEKNINVGLCIDHDGGDDRTQKREKYDGYVLET